MAKKIKPGCIHCANAVCDECGPLNPTPRLLSKLGSIIVHADELASPDGHEFDAVALKQLLRDEDVRKWLYGMRELALLPEKRSG